MARICPACDAGDPTSVIRFGECECKPAPAQAPRVVAECWTCIRNIDGNPVPHSMSAPGEAFYHHTAGHDVRKVTR